MAAREEGAVGGHLLLVVPLRASEVFEGADGDDPVIRFGGGVVRPALQAHLDAGMVEGGDPLGLLPAQRQADRPADALLRDQVFQDRAPAAADI